MSRTWMNVLESTQEKKTKSTATLFVGVQDEGFPLETVQKMNLEEWAIKCCDCKTESCGIRQIELKTQKKISCIYKGE